MYLISVYFDNASSARLQSLIEQIAKASGNHYMTEKQVPPHLTLSAIEARSADILMPAVKQLQGRLGQGTIQFVTVGQLFPYVLYTMPVLNPYLQELALQVNHAVRDIPDGCRMSHLEKLCQRNKCGRHFLSFRTDFPSLRLRSRNSDWQK